MLRWYLQSLHQAKSLFWIFRVIRIKSKSKAYSNDLMLYIQWSSCRFEKCYTVSFHLFRTFSDCSTDAFHHIEDTLKACTDITAGLVDAFHFYFTALKKWDYWWYFNRWAGRLFSYRLKNECKEQNLVQKDFVDIHEKYKTIMYLCDWSICINLAASQLNEHIFGWCFCKYRWEIFVVKWAVAESLVSKFF